MDDTELSLGGCHRQTLQSFVGPMAESSLAKWYFDAVFLGADAVNADLGLCEATATQTRWPGCFLKRPPVARLLLGPFGATSQVT